MASNSLDEIALSTAATAAALAGTITVSAPVGGATGAKQDTGNTSLASIDGKLTNPLPVSGPLTDAQIRAAALPVSGPLTDAQLRLTAVPISGTVAATGPVTDAQIRATPLPVSGTVAVTGPLTDAQLRLSAVPVSAASLPLPTGATTETTLSGVKTGTDRIPAQGQALAAASLPVVLTAAQVTTLTPPAAITGFATEAGNLATIAAKDFATQTTLAALNTKVTAVNTGAVVLAAGVANIGDVDVLTLPALVAGTANIGDVDVLTLPAVTIAAAQTLATVTTVGAVTGITNALPAGTNRIGAVRLVDSADADLTAAKNAQATRSQSVTRVIDAGRNARHFMLDAYVAAPAVEAVQSVVQWFNNAAVAGTTQPAVVTAGKTLRLCSWTIATKSLATVGSAVVRVRVNTAGLGVLASPLIFSFEAGSRAGATTVAMTGGLDTLTGVFPEGFEIPAGSGLAFSMAGYGPAGVLALQGVTRFAVYGYEY